MKWNCYEKRNEIHGLGNAGLLSKEIMEWCMDDYMQDITIHQLSYMLHKAHSHI
jgi:hypothetical protein